MPATSPRNPPRGRRRAAPAQAADAPAQPAAFVLTPLPAPPPAPDRDSADSWSAASMQDHLDARTRIAAHDAAMRAVHRERVGADHLDVMLALAGAETIAARLGPDEQALHAARLDAYAAAHGLRGWYRTRDLRGRHHVAVNKIRTRDEGERGRYFTHTADAMHGPDRYWVIDRDSGRTAARLTTPAEAADWIRAAENTPTA
ncbi:hypothetical protein [Kitasatospora sp. NPDC088783]|uniref:hypothetical protein n=1 Tax=Kitasatospora sp. NPDC088783 TaxID=3364077 RepID=UPI0038280050